MGKSPAKWIKSVLFGKKSSSKSGSTRARDVSKGASNKGYAAIGKDPAFSESSPVISDPVLVSSHNNETVPEMTKGENSNSQCEVEVQDVSYDLEKQGTAGSATSTEAERLREEQAAVKAQAAFRGYLARRAFRALKGIIRLQALIRGHLVRRQAVSSLRATWLIVKFQALVRGRNVRLSQASVQANLKLVQQNFGGAKPDAWKQNLSSNVFARKLLSSPILVEALHIQYDEMDPNSAFNWLERWTISRVWKPISQPKRAGVDAKPHTRKASYAMETESAKLKRNARKSSAMAPEPSQTNTVIETEKTEKTKRNSKKFTNPPVDPVPDAQLTELEKVKRSLRKVTNSMAEASKTSNTVTEFPEHQEVHCERPLRNSQQVQTHPENQEPQNGNLSDNAKMDSTVPDLQPDEETVPHPVTIEEVNEPAIVAPAAEIMPLQDINSEENALVNDVEQRSKEEPLSTESLKSSKRRSSFSAKAEYPENGSKNSPALPSYMAATKSAKAKLREQISPRLSSDSAEKNGYTRRHSLPSSTNGKMNSQSPRTQRPTHAGGKEAVKSDKSMISSRDATERPLKAEWKR